MEQGKITLLLVEDDPIYAQFILSALAKSALPLNLIHFGELDQALAYLRGDESYSDRSTYPMPAIVLIDVILGGSSGFPILGWLRDNGHLQNEQVLAVMLTASNRTEHVQEALRLGALSYLVKSPSPENVINLLTKLLLQKQTPPTAEPPSTQLPAQA